MWCILIPQGFCSSNFFELARFCKAIRGFQVYLIGRPFVVDTNNRAVLAMFQTPNSSSFVRHHLVELQYLVLHPVQVQPPIVGHENFLVDVLSRHHYLAQRKRVLPAQAKPPTLPEVVPTSEQTQKLQIQPIEEDHGKEKWHDQLMQEE